MRAQLRPMLALVLLGALVLTGCGGGSHSGNATRVTAAPNTRPSAGTPTTSSPAAASTASSHSGASARQATAAGSRVSAPKAYDGVPFQLHTISMTPTYQPATTVYYDPTGTRPHVGDVIIFFLSRGAAEGQCGTAEIGGAPCRVPHPGLTKTLAMKRVVGLPGDTIAIHHGRVIRNGRPESEPPTVPCGDQPGCEFSKAIMVPRDHYYVMSDDRQLYQEDSRVFGAVSRIAIVGTVRGGN